MPVYHDLTEADFKDTLFRVSKEEYELGVPFSYVNSAGETIIPYGQYLGAYKDTLIGFGIVVGWNTEKYTNFVAINTRGERLYEVHPFDNGPDRLSEGLFRIMRNGRIGYADSLGQIIVEPKFICALPFTNGKAKVSFTCKLEHDDMYTSMLSERWHYIDKQGQFVK